MHSSLRVSACLTLAVLSSTPEGNLYVSSFGTDEVLRYDGRTGEVFRCIRYQEQAVAWLTLTALSIGPEGNLYVSSFGTEEVLRYDGETGEFLGVFVTAESGGLKGPWGLVFGPDGNLYVSSFVSS